MGQKGQGTKHVSFRMPPDLHADYVAVAQSRGVDLSAMLNWILVEYRPRALLLRRNRRRGMVPKSRQDLGREAKPVAWFVPRVLAPSSLTGST